MKTKARKKCINWSDEMTTQGGKMDRDEARKYLAENPEREVIDAYGSRHRMTETGMMQQLHNGTWFGGYGLHSESYSPYPEPKPPLEIPKDVLEEMAQAFYKGAGLADSFCQGMKVYHAKMHDKD